jgi:arylsulfatase A-like enzyme
MLLALCLLGSAQAEERRPNILLAIADDWGWPNAGSYGDAVVETPNFDRIASAGVLFTNAFAVSPSCSPSRAGILAGQHHWRLQEAANLFGTFPVRLEVYPTLLERAGYHVGHTRKGWAPGYVFASGRVLIRNPAGNQYEDFETFLEERPPGSPFCFWFGSGDPHRPYRAGSGKASGIDTQAIEVPPYLPDNEITRSDLADYYFEVQRFDRELGELLSLLEKTGELEHTLVVVTGDQGMPFPRAKATLYDAGTRVPLAISWPGVCKPRRRIDDFVSLIDLAPTFLEAAGLKPTAAMTGRSLLPLLESPASGQVDPSRDSVVTGKERHVPCQEAPETGGTPMRAIRTEVFLYIRNFEPDRWPSGTPDAARSASKGRACADVDAGPTKDYMLEHRDRDAHHERLFALSFAKRPAEELYDLSKDPYQLQNVAADRTYAATLRELSQALEKKLRETRDPRVIGGGERFDEFPFLGAAGRGMAR